MRILLALAVFCGLGMILALAQCSGESGAAQLGVEIPKDAPVVRLSDVLDSPAAYHGRQVVIKGRVAGQCPSLCEFFMKEGPYQATIFPKGYKFPKLETGRSVTVYAAVTAGPQNVVLTALGVRLEKE